jgi:DNA-binding NarL/FixJ family response regulator
LSREENSQRADCRRNSCLYFLFPWTACEFREEEVPGVKGKKFRVLLAESDPGEAADSLRTLYPEPDSHLELSVVSSIPTLLGTIDRAAPETIFLDLSLGHPDPLDAVRRVHRAAPGIPLIVLADVADKNCATRCISEGAIDYLLKGFMDTRAVERALRTALELNTLEGLADLLRDELTGLYSRDGFTTLGNRSMDTAMRSEKKRCAFAKRRHQHWPFWTW